MIGGSWELADQPVIAEIVSFKFCDRPFLKTDKVQRDRGNTLTLYSAPHYHHCTCTHACARIQTSGNPTGDTVIIND